MDKQSEIIKVYMSLYKCSNYSENLQLGLSFSCSVRQLKKMYQVAGLPHFIHIYSVMFKALVAQLCPTLCDPMDCTDQQAPLSMEFSRPEYWSGQPFPSSGDLPNPGIEPKSPTSQADSLLSEPPGKTLMCLPLKRALGLYCCCCC